jgi:secreted PhoX family phosphatase
MDQRAGSRFVRRDFLKLSAGLAATAMVSDSLWSRALAAPINTDIDPYGPLLPADANGIMLPAGFRSRVVARAGQSVGGTSYSWHVYPDGGATFPSADGGYTYVSNSEMVLTGGASALRFSATGAVVAAYRICGGTQLNCAGGKTPWGTWLTCEEYAGGHVWECDPGRANSQVRRRAMGTFNHEAAAIDPATGLVYLTEDQPDGRFYRFRPNTAGDLSAGMLEVAEVRGDATVVWHRVPRPNPTLAIFDVDPTRKQVSTSTPFNGGEGIVYSQGLIYFTTKGDNRVWEYEPAGGLLGVLYDAALDPGRQLTGVDNMAAASGGDLVVAEDGGNMELVVLTPEGTASALLRVLGQDGSEPGGPAFDPSGQRLYFSSQRGGPVQLGITYEVTGPFRG